MTIAWNDDAMAFAKAHVEAGVLSVESDGTIWRCAIMVRGAWRQCKPRRAENPGGKGYLRVSLCIPGTRQLAIVMAHCLVYELKVGPIPDGLQINHKNLIKTDNRPDNLEPVTGAGNIQHSYANGRTRPWSQATSWRGRPRITPEQCADAVRMRAEGASLKTIAKKLGIGVSHAHRLTTGGAQ
jgi:hypothetical protein